MNRHATEQNRAQQIMFTSTSLLSTVERTEAKKSTAKDQRHRLKALRSQYGSRQYKRKGAQEAQYIP